MECVSYVVLFKKKKQRKFSGIHHLPVQPITVLHQLEAQET